MHEINLDKYELRTDLVIDHFPGKESCSNYTKKVINKDIYVEEKEVIDDESGEVKKKYRSILFDTTGKTYATGSYGIYNILKKIVSIYGLPTTWENPIKVKVSKRPIGNGKQTLTLVLV